MDPPIYDGKVHPTEYIKKMRAYCNFKQITNEQEILKFAIMMVDSTINLPENITSFDALSNALKEHISFTVFKNFCKRKLQALKYEDGDTVNFITNFRTFCRDAEITNLEEQKRYLFNTLPYNFFKNEFTKKQKDVNSLDELIKMFEEIVTEDSRIIRNGSIVALKHVATGKYLSSCNKMYSRIDNNNIMVYCDDFGANALWSIHTTPTSSSSIEHKSLIQLEHQIFGKRLGTNISKESPISKHFEVYCGSNNRPWIIKRCHNQDNNQRTVESQDIVLLQLQREAFKPQKPMIAMNDKDIFLRSHDLKFTVGHTDYQEVFTHDQRIEENDHWCIELVEQK